MTPEEEKILSKTLKSMFEAIEGLQNNMVIQQKSIDLLAQQNKALSESIRLIRNTKKNNSKLILPEHLGGKQ